jgi:hypothetical protein
MMKLDKSAFALGATLAGLLAIALPCAANAATTTPNGIWMSYAEIAKLPMSGKAWDKVKAAADGWVGTPNIADQDSKHDVNTLAIALVYARTGNPAYRTKAATAIMSAVGTEAGGRTLALSRNLVSYVIAADLIDLRTFDATQEQKFPHLAHRRAQRNAGRKDIDQYARDSSQQLGYARRRIAHRGRYVSERHRGSRARCARVQGLAGRSHRLQRLRVR